MSLIAHVIGRRSRRPLSASIAVLLIAATSVSGQIPGHAYVPIEHWSTPYVEHLIRRGVIPDPSPMLRPWRAGDVAAALAAVRPGRATGYEKSLLKTLSKHYQADADTVTLWVQADAGVRSSSHARINSELRAAGSEQTFEQIGANGAIQYGSVGLVMHPVWDPNFNHDPDYGGRTVPIKIRYQEAYATIRSRYLAVDFGRLRRHWGPIGLPSLIVSSEPYAFDHLYFQAGIDRFTFQVNIAQLDDMANSGGEISRRFWITHRASARLAGFLDLGIWEASVVSGPGQTLEFWFINPTAVQFQGEDEQLKSTNALIGGDGELRLPAGFRMAGSLTLDDLQVVDSGSISEEPPSYAITGIMDWAYGPGTVSLAYTQVSNLSYRTHDLAEAFLTDQNLERGHRGVGLARNFTDYDQLTLKGGILAAPGLRLEPEITILRQGEGDLRDPFPPAEELPTTPTLFAGNVETTVRFALSGDFLHPKGIHASFSAGWHFINDLNHIEGASDNRFVGTLHVRYIFSGAWPLRPHGIR